MHIKEFLTFLFILVSLGLKAQGKLYITPRIGFHTGSYDGVDSINNKQDLIKTRRFQQKWFHVGIYLSYIHDKYDLSMGIEQGDYTSGIYYGGDRYRPDNVIHKSSVATQNRILFTEFKYDAWGWNVKLPKWLKKELDTEKLYLIASRFMPMIGFEYRSMPVGGRFINDYEEFRSISTLNGDIPYARLYHSYQQSQVALRAGVDWVFHDGEKRRFVVNLMYSFAFKDAGYWQYRFYHDTPREFHFRTTTRGNGLSLKIGVPIKLFEVKKK